MPQTAHRGFFDLPLELREMIYTEYLLLKHRPTTWMIHNHTRIDQSSTGHQGLEPISPQVQIELTEVSKRQPSFCFRISSQAANFDSLAVSCFRLLGRAITRCPTSASRSTLRIRTERLTWYKSGEAPTTLSTISARLRQSRVSMSASWKTKLRNGLLLMANLKEP